MSSTGGSRFPWCYRLPCVNGSSHNLPRRDEQKINPRNAQEEGSSSYLGNASSRTKTLPAQLLTSGHDDVLVATPNVPPQMECVPSIPTFLAAELSKGTDDGVSVIDPTDPWKEKLETVPALTGNGFSQSSTACSGSLARAAQTSKDEADAQYLDEQTQTLASRRSQPCHPAKRGSVFRGFFSRKIYLNESGLTEVVPRKEPKERHWRWRSPKSSARVAPMPTPKVRSEPEKEIQEVLPIPSKNDKKPCLVLDLDETLVHSSFKVSESVSASEEMRCHL
eukprot:gb/GECG01003051.1/.p1 GENE.gb/GECG01003051.1/~~gb/GECG01003051.1/.p1  ORF type:complete len:279 (+),score=37.73 gb/GECG01003051.1/:1-837(+)